MNTAPAAVPGSRRAAAIPASGIRAIASAAWARPDTLHLELGEPAHDTAAHIVDAADRAARSGRTHYGPSAGLPEFREAAAAKLVRDNGWSAEQADPARVVVSAGGVGGLFAAYCALLDVNDEILVPDPGWPNFVALAHAVGARPVAYRPDPGTGAAPDTAALDALLTRRTRAILVNSPANPTGAVWDAHEVTRVVEWADARGLCVISDECYDQLGFEAAPVSAAATVPHAQVVSVFSLSKAYAMTGWRIGYLVAPPALAPAITRVQEAIASCVSTIGQLAGVAALSGPQESVTAMRAGYRETRDVATAACDRLGLRYLRPGGAFYLWLELPGSVPDTTRFAVDLVERHGVAVAPGTAFGSAGAGRVRVSLAAACGDVVTGLERIAAAARSAA